MSARKPTPLNAYYIAINLQDILYGIQLVLYFITIRTVLIRGRKWERVDIFCVLFSTVMLILVTILIATAAVFGQEMWVIQTSYPGGPAAYWKLNQSLWYLYLQHVAIAILQLMTDALLIHRCWIIYNRARGVVVVTCAIWFATFVLCIAQNLAFDFGGPIMKGTAFSLCLAYYSLLVLSNTTLTSMICYRVVCHGRLVRAQLGRGYSAMYFAVVEVVAGLALPIIISGIAFVVTLGLDSVVNTPIAAVYFMMMCISPQMLILWVLVGREFEQGTSGVAPTRSDIKFQHHSLMQGTNEREGTSLFQQLPKVHSVDTSHGTNDWITHSQNA